MAITPIDLILRLVKGSSITATENDANLTNLKTACEELDAVNQQNNLSAIIAPTATDDTGSGYAIGSRWVDTVLDKEYVCLDATASSAVWKETTASASGDLLSTNNLSDLTNFTTARSNLGVEIGVDVQAYNANTTLQGNTFNGISQLVQTDGTGKLPAIDGSALLNLPSGFADPMTTIGDIIYRNGSNVTARLPIGTTGQVIGTSDGVNLSFITPAGGGDLVSTNNLSDLTNFATARSNLGLAIGTDVQAYDVDTAKTDVAQTFTAPQRTSTSAEDNAISFNGNNNFTLTATAANITVTNQTIGQGGTIIISSSENITGWGTEFDWGNAGVPTGLTGVETFAYYTSGASGADSIKIGRL